MIPVRLHQWSRAYILKLNLTSTTTNQLEPQAYFPSAMPIPPHYKRHPGREKENNPNDSSSSESGSTVEIRCSMSPDTLYKVRYGVVLSTSPYEKIMAQ